MKQRKQYFRKAPAKGEVETKEIAGTEPLCAVKTAIKQLQGVLKIKETEFKESILEEFLDQGSADAIHATEGDGSATISLKRRSPVQKLSPDECAMMERHGIEPDLVIRYEIAEKYHDNDAVMSRLMEALDAAGLPDDILEESQPKYVVPAGAVESAMQDADLLRVVSQVSIRARYDGDALTEVAR